MGSEEETRPSPTAVFSSHQLMTHMWFVMHQPHAGNPKNNPIKASYLAKANVLGRPLPVLSLLGVGGGMYCPEAQRGGALLQKGSLPAFLIGKERPHPSLPPFWKS